MSEATEEIERLTDENEVLEKHLSTVTETRNAYQGCIERISEILGLGTDSCVPNAVERKAKLIAEEYGKSLAYAEFMNTQTKELDEQLDGMTEARDRFCGSVNRLAEIVGLSGKQCYAPEAVERKAKYELVTLRERVKDLEGKRFPIQGGPSIPWRMIEPHDRQCKSNHCEQDLEDIARRLGLSPAEALCVLDDQSWRESPWGNFMNDEEKSKAAWFELERRRAAFEDETVTLQARIKALEKEVETVNVNWDADRQELEEDLANSVPLCVDEDEASHEMLQIVHAIMTCDEEPLPDGLCQCTKYISAQFEGLRAEIKRLQAKVQYAKDFGLDIGIVKSSDCPEGKLGAATREGTDLHRLEMGIADLIEADLKIKALLEDPDSEVGRLKKAAVDCDHRVLGCPVVTPDEVDLLDPAEELLEEAEPDEGHKEVYGPGSIPLPPGADPNQEIVLGDQAADPIVAEKKGLSIEAGGDEDEAD